MFEERADELVFSVTKSIKRRLRFGKHTAS